MPDSKIATQNGIKTNPIREEPMHTETLGSFLSASEELVVQDKNSSQNTENRKIPNMNQSSVGKSLKMGNKEQREKAKVVEDSIKTVLEDKKSFAESQQDTGPISLTLNLKSAGVSLASDQDVSFDKTKVQKWGKYEILKEIGRGGMGRVMLWKDQNIQRVVASKLILQERSLSEQTVQRFFEEGQITGQLEHPNIVPIYEMGMNEKGSLYFTMKYVKGKSLKDIFKEIKGNKSFLQREWSLSKMLQIFQTVCYAVEYAHSKKVVHRDLKPENIMLGNFGEVMVMDWGLAKVLGQGQEVLSEDSVTTLRSQGGFRTITGQVAGTPMYMPPEQAKGDVDKIDPRSDIYSLGAILYEMVTGTNAVYGKETLAILYNVSEGKLRRIPKNGTFGPISKELHAIIQKALQYSRENRYQSAREMAEDIQRFLDGREVHACPYTFFDKTCKTLRHYRKEIALVMVTILAIVPLFLLLEQRKMRSRSEDLAITGEKALSELDYQDVVPATSVPPHAPGSVMPPHAPGSVMPPHAPGSVMPPHAPGSVMPPYAPGSVVPPHASEPSTPGALAETSDRPHKNLEMPFNEPHPPPMPPKGDVNLPNKDKMADSMPFEDKVSEKEPELKEEKLKQKDKVRHIHVRPNQFAPQAEGMAPDKQQLYQDKEEQEKAVPSAKEEQERVERVKKEAMERFQIKKQKVLEAIKKYKEAYEISNEYRFKTMEAKAWLIFFNAAKEVGDTGSQDLAKFQIESLVTKEDFEKSYKNNLK